MTIAAPAPAANRQVPGAQRVTTCGDGEGERQHQADRLAHPEHGEGRHGPAPEAAQEGRGPPRPARRERQRYPELSESRRRRPPTLKWAATSIAPGRRTSNRVQSPSRSTQALPEVTVQYGV